jgi:hypothetical protein
MTFAVILAMSFRPGRFFLHRSLGGRCFPDRSGAECHFHDVDLRTLRLLGGPATGVAGLEALDAAGTGFRRAAARDGGIEVRGVRHAQDVDGVVLVGHPQRHPQVRVGAQAFLDDAGRALGGEDQVQPEGPAAGGDVDHAVHELGHLGGQGSEFVHHDDQVRRGVGIRLALEREQVLGLFPVEHVLPVVQLSPQGRQGAAHEVWARDP